MIKGLPEKLYINARLINAIGLAAVGFLWAFKVSNLFEEARKQLEIERARAERLLKELQEISEMKSRFFTNISHEFRTPLTLILGPAQAIADADKKTDVNKSAEIIKRNALRLLRLINQLLDISKLDGGKLKLQVAQGNLVSFVKGTVMLFESLAANKDILLEVKTEKEFIQGYFDKSKLENILINLISNACKFTAAGGNITVSLSEVNEKAVITIRDNGIGIPEKEFTKLFDRFYQVDSSHTRRYGGTGIGLALTKELVQLHHGEITVNSSEGAWTEFTIELPLKENFYTKEEIASSENADDQDTPAPISEQIQVDIFDIANDQSTSGAEDLIHESSADDRDIILVVEDNPDVRVFIRESLGNEFEVIEAANGVQGLGKAEKIIPDLVISDIMMPVMDGYEFTRLLKNNDKTDHIPVIHLTAKSDHFSRITGLETGADDYLVKPFNTTELKVRVNNLIELRRKLQKKFGAGLKPEPKAESIKLSPANEKFILKIEEIILMHLGEEEFSIEDFSKEAGFSRTQLHRKLKAITGKSASRYLRSYRLRKALDMMEQQKGNISEISYLVGFSSPIYFSKCFKEEFGHTPTEMKLLDKS